MRMQKRGSKKVSFVTRRQLSATHSKIGMGAAFELRWKDAPDEILWWIIQHPNKKLLQDMATLELKFRDFLILNRQRIDRVQLSEMSREIRREERRLRRKVKQHLSTAMTPQRQQELIDSLRRHPRF